MARSIRGGAYSARRVRMATHAQRTLNACLDAVWHEVMVSGTGPCSAERIHRLRVSTRRSLASLSLFRDLMPSKPRRWFRRRLRQILRAAARIRDLDIVGDHLAATSISHDGHHRLTDSGRARLVALLASQRVVAEGSIRHLPTAIGHRSWLAHRARLVAGIRAAGESPLEHLHLVHRRLERRVRAFVRLTRRMPKNARAIHRLRLAGKDLRYASEALVELFHSDAVSRCIAALRRLQGVLGDYTDHTAAVATVRHLGRAAEVPEDRSTWACLRRIERGEADRALGALVDWWDRDRRHELRRRCRRALRKAFA